jgi:hypothetical protein
MVFKAPILGLTDPEAAPIVAFVLLIGGTFAVLQRTGAIDGCTAPSRTGFAKVAHARAPAVAVVLDALLSGRGGLRYGGGDGTVRPDLCPAGTGSGLRFNLRRRHPLRRRINGLCSGLLQSVYCRCRPGNCGRTAVLRCRVSNGAVARMHRRNDCVRDVARAPSATRPAKSPTYAIDKAKRLDGLQ